MKFDLTITLSVLIGLCATISPIITTLISNAHSKKMKKLELEHSTLEKSLFYRRGVYEEYVRYTAKLFVNSSKENLDAYAHIYPMAMIYFPDNFYADLVEINSLITSRNMNLAKTSFENLVPKIRAILKTK